METPNLDSIDPVACINRKLRRIFHLIDDLYQEHLQSFGLKGSMLSMLFIIAKKKHVHQKILAEALVLDQSTVSRDLRRLHDRGWIQFSIGERDARKRIVSMTEEGLQQLEHISPIWEQIHTQVLQHIGPNLVTQIDTLDRILSDPFSFKT
ncbi:MAG: MarR family transcriptional regulator [Saprospiraceae bacterium]|nr:MarR family transcriptional regulator [Saprospiraceae bacterium]